MQGLQRNLRLCFDSEDSKLEPLLRRPASVRNILGRGTRPGDVASRYADVPTTSLMRNQSEVSEVSDCRRARRARRHALGGY